MSNPFPKEILYQVDDQGIAILQVNRPRARNALNWAAQKQFAGIVENVGADENVRALIITGSGDNAFVSGGDLKELQNHPEREGGERLNRIMRDALANLQTLPIPVIAAVNGDAFGGGCEIVIACDLRVAAHGVRFSFAQVRNGLTTGWGGTALLVHLIGQSRAMDLLLTGRTFTAQEAKEWGLIHYIAEEQLVLQAAQELAAEIITLPKEALAAAKRLIYATGQLSAAELTALEAQLFVELWETENHLEALAAFREKRPPVFNQDWETK